MGDGDRDWQGWRCGWVAVGMVMDMNVDEGADLRMATIIVREVEMVMANEMVMGDGK